ncbi:MAG: glycosyltransferase family 2 protein [Candidatus Paceibacterota bacterium]
MRNPLVSIVIPCYNGADCVAEAIQSALGQSYRRKEVIVVDDGSKDRSAEVVRSFGDAVRYFKQENAGVAVARNRGAAEARGELLQFLDQDDLLYPDKLERQVPHVILHRPGLVFCDADVTDYQTRQHRGHWGGGFVDTDDPLIHTLVVTVQTSGPIHWREAFWRVGGFRTDSPPCEDRDLHLRLACNGIKFYHLKEVLYAWRQKEGSQAKQNPLKGMYVQRRIGDDAYNLVIEQGTMTAQRQFAFAGYFAWIGRRALQLGDFIAATENFHHAREIHEDGGYSLVYSPPVRVIARTLGPQIAERVVSWKRWFVKTEPLI